MSQRACILILSTTTCHTHTRIINYCVVFTTTTRRVPEGLTGHDYLFTQIDHNYGYYREGSAAEALDALWPRPAANKERARAHTHVYANTSYYQTAEASCQFHIIRLQSNNRFFFLRYIFIRFSYPLSPSRQGSLPIFVRVHTHTDDENVPPIVFEKT